MENFIFTDYLNDVSVCDELIDYFQKSPYKSPGALGEGEIKKDRKDSTDIAFLWNDENATIQKYIKNLIGCVDKYMEKYNFANHYLPFSIVEPINIQHYSPGQGFHVWHTERDGSAFTQARHLVFMTYLNDVTDGGETEWFYQKLKIQPRKGLTAVWPVDWTHTHRGLTSLTQDKYVTTGWFRFTET